MYRDCSRLRGGTSKSIQLLKDLFNGEEVSKDETGLELKVSCPGAEVVNCIFSLYA